MSRRELGRAALRRSFVILQAITAVSSGRTVCVQREKWQTLSMHPPPGYLYILRRLRTGSPSDETPWLPNKEIFVRFDRVRETGNAAE